MSCPNFEFDGSGDFDELMVNKVGAITLPIQDILYNRIWNMDKQFPDNCLAFGGITTGIQILRHMMIFRISIGLSFGTSNPDTWRLKLSTRCHLLVDHSELCTNVIFNFSQLILEASARKKETYLRWPEWNFSTSMALSLSMTSFSKSLKSLKISISFDVQHSTRSQCSLWVSQMSVDYGGSPKLCGVSRYSAEIHAWYVQPVKQR